MKVVIIPHKKRVYVKGDLNGKNVEEYLEELFSELADYRVVVEPVSFTISKEYLKKETTTIS